MAKDKSHLPAPLPPTGKVISTARDATEISGPVSGFFYRVGERARRKAIDENTATARAFEANANAHSAVFSALVNLRNRVDDYRARDELADRYYQLAKARAHSEIDQALALEGQKTAEARRARLNAKHGFQATKRNRDKNFRLGDVRKDAQIAEIEDILPDPPTQAAQPQTSSDPLAALKDAIARAEEERVQKAADAKDTTDLQSAIDQAREILRAAGVEI